MALAGSPSCPAQPLSSALFHDADGKGAGAAVQFATLAPDLALTASDFAVF